jgi:hypothetical protein
VKKIKKKNGFISNKDWLKKILNGEIGYAYGDSDNPTFLFWDGQKFVGLHHQVPISLCDYRKKFCTVVKA